MTPFAGFPFGLFVPQMFTEPAFNYSGAITYAIKPNLVNEFNMGKSGMTGTTPISIPRIWPAPVFDNPPKLFPVTYGDPKNVQSLTNPAHMYDFIPNVGFGSIPSKRDKRIHTTTRHPNLVHSWAFTDNVSWVKGVNTPLSSVSTRNTTTNTSRTARAILAVITSVTTATTAVFRCAGWTKRKRAAGILRELFRAEPARIYRTSWTTGTSSGSRRIAGASTSG